MCVASWISEIPIRVSGRITTTRHSSSVASAARFGLPGMRSNMRRCKGMNRMAKATPQKTAS